MFYVYEHWRPDTNTCFYVGKGKGRRAYEFSNRNQRHNRIVAKLKSLGLKPIVRFLVINMAEEAAFQLERERIAYWRSTNTQLCNATDGGENGPTGLKHSPETLVKMSIAHKGNKNGSYVHSPETRAKRRKSQTGQKRTPEQCANISKGLTGHRHSDETKAKISIKMLDSHQKRRLQTI